MTAPILDPSVHPSLPAVADSATDPAGIPVWELIPDGAITNPNGEAPAAIAITALDASLGTWEYSIDDRTWSVIDGQLVNSTTDDIGLLLSPGCLLRLLPYHGLTGTLDHAIEFRAWDDYTGSTGSYVYLSGQTAFSSSVAYVSATVTHSNEAPSFERATGQVRTGVGNGTVDYIRNLAIRPDGGIVVFGTAGAYPAGIGQYRLTVLAYGADGFPDVSFGGGRATSASEQYPYFTGQGALQGDGKVLVAGLEYDQWDSQLEITRYNADGTIDSSFAGTPFQPFGFNALDRLLVQPNGQILLVGDGVVRLNADGSVDETFGAGGRVNLSYECRDAALQSDGSILVAASIQDAGGSHPGVFRLLPDGTLDPSFNAGAASIAPVAGDAASVRVQPDGKIVVGGSSSDHLALARFNADGTLDSTFGGGTGTVVSHIAAYENFRSMAIQPDGKILVVGNAPGVPFPRIILVRFNTDGTLDTSFNGTGTVFTSLDFDSSYGFDVAVLPNGDIIVGAQVDAPSDIALLRYHADGSLDTSFGMAPAATAGVSWQEGSSAVALDPGLIAYDADLAQAGSYAGASLTVARHGGASSDDLFSTLGNLEFVGGGAIVSGVSIGTVTNSDGVLTISFNENATQARVDEALSAIGYANASDAPPAQAVIDYLLSDGNTGSQGTGGALEASTSVAVTIAAVNDAPAIATDAAISYSENDAATPIAPSATVFDPDSPDFAGGSVTVHFVANATDSDELVIIDHGTGPGDIGVSGSSISYGGATIGSFVGGTHGTDLVVTLTSSAATPLAVQALIRDIAYRNGSDTPSTLDRSVEIAVVDGDGGASLGTANTVIRVAAVDDAPQGVVTIDGEALLGQTLSAHAVLTDADGIGPIGFQWRADGIDIDGATGSTLMLTAAEVGAAITVVASYTDQCSYVDSMTSSATGRVIEGMSVNGTAAADSLAGTTGNDQISGFAGNDTLTGGGGGDTLIGGTGNDVLDGGEEGDVYVVSLAAEHAVAEVFDTGTGGSDELRFAATSGTLMLFAGDAGLERVVIGTGTADAADTSATKAVNVNAAAVQNALSLVGNAGANALTGTSFDDTIDGGAGADKMSGGLGNDTYFVDNGRDGITDKGGIDSVFSSASFVLASAIENLTLTGTGAVNATGNASANEIQGNSAANVIDGKGGVDILDGRGGSDIYVIARAADHAVAEIDDSGATGIDEVRFAATSASTLKLFAADTGIEAVVCGTGTAAVAVTRGTAALNVDASAVLNGLSITGNSGANTIVGTGFDDVIAGGKGKDMLTGGAGHDIFVFDTAPSTSNNLDTITDFETGVDALRFSKTIFVALAGSPGALSADQFWSGAGMISGHDADDRLVYDTATGVLYYDADGSGSGAAVAIALLGVSSHADLTASAIQIGA